MISSSLKEFLSKYHALDIVGDGDVKKIAADNWEITYDNHRVSINKAKTKADLLVDGKKLEVLRTHGSFLSLKWKTSREFALWLLQNTINEQLGILTFSILSIINSEFTNNSHELRLSSDRRFMSLAKKYIGNAEAKFGKLRALSKLGSNNNRAI